MRKGSSMKTRVWDQVRTSDKLCYSTAHPKARAGNQTSQGLRLTHKTGALSSAPDTFQRYYEDQLDNKKSYTTS